MKNFGWLAGLLGGSGLALLAGCATESMSRTARAAPPATYAVVAVDHQGVLSATEFKKVEVGIIQYLLDDGFVRAEDKYVTDVMDAEIVFRVRIAWQGTKGGYTVTAVEPTFSPRPVAQSGAGGGPATAYAPRYAAGGWYDNPWWYDGYYGPDFWPYAGFAGLSAFGPFYLDGRIGRHDGDRGGHVRSRGLDRDGRDHPDQPSDHHPGSGRSVWSPEYPHPQPRTGNWNHRWADEHRSGRDLRPGVGPHVIHRWTGHAASVRPGGYRSDHPAYLGSGATPKRSWRSYSPAARTYSPPTHASAAAPARSYSRSSPAPAERSRDHDANARRPER